MLFFRSEDDLHAWCGGRGREPGPAVPVSRLWSLSKVWYGSRLDPKAPRPTPEEARAIFAGVGLTGPFWDPVHREEQPT